MPNFFATFIEVLRDRPAGHDWELEPGVTCGDYLFGMLQVRLYISFAIVQVVGNGIRNPPSCVEWPRKVKVWIVSDKTSQSRDMDAIHLKCSLIFASSRKVWV